MATNRKWNRYYYLTCFAIGIAMCFYAYFTNQEIFAYFGLIMYAIGIFRWKVLEPRLKE